MEAAFALFRHSPHVSEEKLLRDNGEKLLSLVIRWASVENKMNELYIISCLSKKTYRIIRRLYDTRKVGDEKCGKHSLEPRNKYEGSLTMQDEEGCIMVKAFSQAQQRKS